MRSTRAIQILTVALVAGLIVFLFFAGRNNSTALVKDKVHANITENNAGAGFDFALLEKDVQAKLGKADAENILKLEGKLNGRGPMEENTRNLAEAYEKLNQPILAGYYYRKLAEANPQRPDYWFKMGKSFFEAESTVDDSVSFSYFVNESARAFDKTLQLDPQNLEAKSDQAVNYIEGKGQPMVGIGLLREVLQADPANRKALYYLGLLSIQSGQMDKAVERFEKLVSLGPKDDPNYPFYYRSLGQAYAALGKKDKAVEAYIKYKEYTGGMADPRPGQEADRLIKSVK